MEQSNQATAMQSAQADQLAQSKALLMSLQEQRNEALNREAGKAAIIASKDATIATLRDLLSKSQAEVRKLRAELEAPKTEDNVTPLKKKAAK